VGLFGNSREAARVAQRAEDKANDARTIIASGLAKLEEHIKTCDNRARDLQQELQRDRQAVQEWRVGLGQRLDAQDRLMSSVARMVIGLLGTTIIALASYILPHIVTFSK
jgi:hypothetical protein